MSTPPKISTRRDFLSGSIGAATGYALAGGLFFKNYSPAADGEEPKTASTGEVKPTHSTEPDGTIRGRLIPQNSIPFIDCEGTAFECGEILGGIWKSALKLEAEQAKGSRPWWKSPRYKPLIEKHCPHLPDVYRGMAKGAEVNENALGERGPKEETAAGCTAFALAPEATIEGIPISGQTKDVGVLRARELLVLRMKMSDAPSLLTLTYTGSTWLYGHGFVQGRIAIFRNSLYVDEACDGLPMAIWALIALHCQTVEEVVEIVNRHGVQGAFHVVVADRRGGIVGIECGKGGSAFLRPAQGVYAHANAVLSEGSLRKTEKDAPPFTRAESLHRTKRLTERLQAERGRLTAELAYGALCDHDGYPVSICRHQSLRAYTGAAVIAEPTRGLLHVTHGPPCRHWPQTYSIA